LSEVSRPQQRGMVTLDLAEPSRSILPLQDHHHEVVRSSNSAISTFGMVVRIW
jgi:hypothetical protein